MFKKASLIFSVLLLVNLVTILLYSCRCKTDKRRYCVDLKSVSLSVQDNGGLEPGPLVNQTVYAKALILSVATQEVQYECRRSVPALMNAAYAMCKDPDNKNGYTILGTQIFTNRDYDLTHPAGTDIRDLCEQKGNDYYLMAAPDDTSGTYTFVVQLVYEQSLMQVKDTLLATTAPLKLRK